VTPITRDPERPVSLFEPAGAPLVRAPLLPIEAYLELTDLGPEGARQTLVGPAPPQGPLARSRDRIRSALAVASLSLFDALEHTPRRVAKAATRARSLARYLIRMSYRPTPYGMFAGVALGRWCDATVLALREPGPIHTRPDMAWLYRLVELLEADDALRPHLILTANPLAHVRVGRVLLEDLATGPDQPEGGVSIRATGAVLRALDVARRPTAYAALHAELLASIVGATPEKVDGLLAELCRKTFLTTDLQPPLASGRLPADYLAERMSALPACQARIDGLRAVLEEAAACDASPSPEAFKKLTRAAADLVRTGDDPAFQVDMAWSLAGDGVGRAIAEEAARAAEVLLRMSPWPEGPPHVVRLREAFLHKYGPDRDVPVRDVLDPDTGLGGIGETAPDSRTPTFRAEQALLDLAATALWERRREVLLDEDAVACLATWQPDTRSAPPSLDLLVLVTGRSAAEVQAGEYRLVVGANVGAGAMGRHLARLDALLGPEIRAELRQQSRREQSLEPDVLFAELAYRPREPRSANVALRLTERDHEICVHASHGMDPQRSLSVDELLVGVRAGRLTLVHGPSNRVVRVCSGHMLNTQAESALVRLLAEIGQDGVAQLLPFGWGAAESMPFLPRVLYGRTILSPGRWRLDAPPPGTEFADHLRRWRARWEVPRYVCNVENDNRLLLDLDDPTQADELRAELAAQGELGVAVEEALPTPGEVWMAGPEGHYVTELVVPLARRPTAEAPAGLGYSESADGRPASTLRRLGDVPRSVRLRPAGSEWLCAKLYVPRWAEEDFLLDHAGPFARRATSQGLAKDWFFVRYEDPEPHVRLRFRGEPERLRDELMPEMCRWAAPLHDAGLCLRYQIDAYEREIERYGGRDGIVAAEDLFAADSRAVVGLLGLRRRGWISLDPVALGVLTVDDLLAAFGLSGSERLGLYQELDDDPEASGDVYRTRKSELRGLLADPLVRTRLGRGAGGTLLSDRREAIGSVAWRIASAHARGVLLREPQSIYGTFVHMHCNRLFGVDPAAEPLVVGLLRRLRDGFRHARPDPSETQWERL
jgi:thiopeptide-type bacteriocin biosynthesis protein